MPKTILIVDDEPDLVHLLVTLFRACGYATLAARDGPTALATAIAQPPDLVLMDVMMPGMSGFEACAALKAHPQTAHVPVLMLSAKADLEPVLASGAAGYLRKPFENRTLLARARALMGEAP